jgi:hypothetical protein
MRIRRFVALALLLALAVPGAIEAQDSTYVTAVYLEAGTGRVMSQAGGGAIYNQRFRVTIAQVNAGLTLLPARAGIKYRLVDVDMIAIGGAVGTCTSVDILATQATSSVKLVANAIAALTQNTLLRAGASNSTILAGGVSFVANDVNTAITIGKTGGTCDTATNVDVLLSYALEI